VGDLKQVDNIDERTRNGDGMGWGGVRECKGLSKSQR
jgi:hypothetical protein